ncbi:MAG: DNA topoisomerase 3 [Hominimerdicola sp.]
MKLVIAEKPSVARAIYPVLGANTKKNGYMEGNGYIVSWCFGHLVSLYYPNDYCDKWAEKPWHFGMLPMLPDTWKFKVSKDCKEQFNILKGLLNDSKIDEVICATDADREGECIFRYVYLLSGSKKPVKRLWVSSLEESAIKDGFAKLKDSNEYDSLYHAGFCRAKADWLVGMNGSRLFSIRYRNNLSLGRVQTPTLAMIVKRDYDVKNFVKQKYFTVELDCGKFQASSERIDDETAADRIIAACTGKNASVIDVKKEIKTVNPPKLYDLTTLQREANKQFGYTAQQTLDYLQALYEAKLSTYPRTDSQYLSSDMEQTAKDMIRHVYSVFTDFGTAPAEPDVKRCINNKKVTGHHAIIPTANITTADLSSLPEGQKNILKLISAKLIMATSEPHKYEAVKVKISCESNDFSANGKTVIEDGWKAIEDKVKSIMKSKNTDDEEKNGSDTKSLPEITQGQTFYNVSAEKAEHWTSPPKPYTEDTLLSAMEHAGQENYDDDTEKKGLGTPATRAATIEGLVKHGYAERNGKKITATDKGVNLISVVPDEVKSPKLTADWEMQLQQIERGEYSANSFMKEITAFVEDICSKYSSSDSSAAFKNGSEPLGTCPKCGKEVKKGKFGFYCTGKCGMNVAKVYGKELTETQLKNLLSGGDL